MKIMKDRMQRRSFLGECNCGRGRAKEEGNGG
jgi:hypothetical protein